MSLIAPVNARVSQLFGANPSSIQPNGHTGKDYAIPINTPIKAAGAGTVVWADWATKLSASNKWWIAPAYAGICVVIDHGNGFLTLYAHLNSTPLNIGDRVAQGQQIGLSGTTGLSTGPHLHFEVLGWPLQPYNGFYGRLNPDKYLTTIAPAASLAANQRKVGADNVNMRSEPKSSAKILRVINGGTTETFTGWIDGETVKGINIWYKDAQGYAWSGGFTSQATTGLTNLNPPKPAVVTNPAQRTAGADNVNMRSQPKTSAPVIRVISAKTNEVFTGYVIGETVKGINIWYKDAQGYAWAGGFTSQATTGLKNLTAVPTPVPVPVPKPTPAPTPSPVQPKTAERTVVDVGVRVRTLPYLTAPVKEVLPANTKVTVKSFVNSDKALDTYVWYALDNGYAHASGFTDQTTSGLTESAKPAAPVTPEPETGYSFTPDFDFVEYRPAHYDNMGNGNFPANPAMIVLHQFDAKDKHPSIDGVIKFFQTSRPTAPTSAHFAVSGDRIIQFVSLKDRAYHAGSVGNNYIGIEVDPQEDEKTVASVKKLITALNAKYGKVFSYTRHQDVPGNATKCGDDIHLGKYTVESPVIVVPPIVDPVPEPTPTPEPAPEPDEEFEALVDDLLVSLKKVLVHLNK